MSEKKRRIEIDFDTGEKYDADTGEILESEQLVADIPLNKEGEPIGYSKGGINLGTSKLDVKGNSGKYHHIISGKQRMLIQSIDRIKEYAREHNIILTDSDINNILYYAAKFYEVKRAKGTEPHLKDNIIGYLIYLDLVQFNKNIDAMRIKPANNSKFIEVLKLLGFSDALLKQLFIDKPMIARWI